MRGGLCLGRLSEGLAEAVGVQASAYFVLTVVVGRFFLLNLLVAIILTEFADGSDESQDIEDAHEALKTVALKRAKPKGVKREQTQALLKQSFKKVIVTSTVKDYMSGFIRPLEWIARKVRSTFSSAGRGEWHRGPRRSRVDEVIIPFPFIGISLGSLIRGGWPQRMAGHRLRRASCWRTCFWRTFPSRSTTSGQRSSTCHRCSAG